MIKKTNSTKARKNIKDFSLKNIFLGIAESFVKHFWGNFIEEIFGKIERFKKKMKLLFFSLILFLLGIIFILTSLTIYLSKLLGFEETFLLIGLMLVFISGVLILLTDQN